MTRRERRWRAGRNNRRQKGADFTRLEMTATVCFVEVTAISNNFARD
jgi:hypothetical protein